jgi:D-lactate dehydrogenase (cytochrome)
VPISRLAQCIAETQDDIARTALPAALFGHVGDGNFHLVIPVKPDDAAELETVHQLNRRLVRRALAMDGTCTGEHGIGLGKIEFMNAEHDAAVDVMRAIKRTLDPDNLLNPGKIFPA